MTADWHVEDADGRVEPITPRTIADLIEAQSFGTPEAKAARESVDPAAAAEIVRRSQEMACDECADTGWVTIPCPRDEDCPGGDCCDVPCLSCRGGVA